MELEEAIERVAPDMNSQGVANTIWAYGTLGVPPSPQVIHVLEAALRLVVTKMNPQACDPPAFVQYNLGILEVRFTADA